jgi:hypothetical protein
MDMRNSPPGTPLSEYAAEQGWTLQDLGQYRELKVRALAPLELRH